MHLYLNSDLDPPRFQKKQAWKSFSDYDVASKSKKQILKCIKDKNFRVTKIFLLSKLIIFYEL